MPTYNTLLQWFAKSDQKENKSHSVEIVDESRNISLTQFLDLISSPFSQITVSSAARYLHPLVTLPLSSFAGAKLLTYLFHFDEDSIHFGDQSVNLGFSLWAMLASFTGLAIVFQRLSCRTDQEVHFEIRKFFDEVLITACKNGDFKKMEFALELNANIEAKDDQGMTPLFCSLINGHFELSQHLINLSADLGAKNKKGESILITLCQQGNLTSVKFFISQLPKTDSNVKNLQTVYELTNSSEIKNHIATTLLFQSAKQGKVDLLLWALKQGADKDSYDEHLETALHKACYAGHAEIVRILLAHHCSINKKDKNRQTAEEITANSDIKLLIINYRKQTADHLVAHVRGFLARKKYKVAIAQQKAQLLHQCPQILAEMARNEKFEEIARLANAMHANRLHEAGKLIEGKEERGFEFKK